MIEEVYVVARKREELLQQVPMASTVFSQQDLQDQTVLDLRDIQYQTPNLNIVPFPAVGGDAGIAMRGQSQFEPVITLDPAVGLYVDGVYRGRSTAALLNMFDVQRVEVLKGPQGTLYGRNTTGGVIHIITNHNKLKTRGGFLDLLVGEHRTQIVTGAANFALLEDKLAARFSFRLARRDGYGRNTLINEDLEDESSDSLRLNVNWTLTEDVELVLSWDRTRERERSALFHVKSIDQTVQDPSCLQAPKPSIGCLINFQITDNLWTSVLDGNPRKVRSDVSSRHDIDVEGVATTMIVDFETLTLKTITAWRQLNRRNVNDIDGSEWAILHPDASADQEQFSQEFQVTDSALNDTLNWLAGLYYFDEDGNDNTTVVSIPVLNPASPSTILPHGKNTSYAIFGNLTYMLSEQVELNLGLRYTWEDRELSEQQFNAGGCTLEFVNRPPCRTEVSESYSDWSHTSSIAYHWNPDLMSYLTYSRGFKSGGFNARATKEVEFEPFGPETVDNFELGVKRVFFDRRVRANVAAFYSRYRDIQRAQLVALSPTEIASTVSNAAKAYVTGGELQVYWLLNTNLNLDLSAGLTIANYDEFNKLDANGEITDRSNLDFPRTPRWNYSSSLQYTLPFHLLPIDGSTRLHIDYSWQSKTYNDVDNSDIAQRSFGLLNLRLSAQLKKPNVEFALFVKNALNEDYATGGLDFTAQFGYLGVFLGPPRSYGAQLTWRFD